MMILAIDPGDEQSAYALIDADTCEPIEAAKVENRVLLEYLAENAFGLDVSRDRGAVEMIASYGMAVGREVFETCVWIGRFIERSEAGLTKVYRREVKLHHCGTVKAGDANIARALIDRFAPGQPNRGKGTKDAPGWFHGFAADIWQAYALAVLVADRHNDRQGVA